MKNFGQNKRKKKKYNWMYEEYTKTEEGKKRLERLRKYEQKEEKG